MILDEMERRARAVDSAKEVARGYAVVDKAGINTTLLNDIVDLILAAEEHGRQIGYETGFAEGMKAAHEAL